MCEVPWEIRLGIVSRKMIGMCFERVGRMFRDLRFRVVGQMWVCNIEEKVSNGLLRYCLTIRRGMEVTNRGQRFHES